MSRERFHAFVQHALLSLPQLLKLLLRIAEDPAFSDGCRVAAAASVVHWLAAANTIKNQKGVLSYLDDVLVLYLALEKLDAEAPKEMERYHEDTPDILAELDEALALIRQRLGSDVVLLERALQKMEKLRFKGRTAAQSVQSEEVSNWFYDEVQSALVDLDLEEDEVARAVKGVDASLDSIGDPKVR